MKRLLLFFVLSSALEAASTAPPYDPTELLLNVRKKVMATVDRLPNYMCTETVDRSRLLPTLGLTDIPRFPKQAASEADPVASCNYLANLRKKPSWTSRQIQSDRLQLDVAVSKEGEMYSLAGENRFRAGAPGDLIGTGLTSTGAFGIFLKTIFASDAASFTYIGDTNFQGRTLAEFGYSVPLEKGGYSIETDVKVRIQGFGPQSKNYSAVVPYDGTFLVDPETFDLVRLTVHVSQVPKQLRVCESTATLDYANVEMSDSDFLLPMNARLHVNYDDGTESENNMTFAGCHEFASESTLRFGAPDISQPAASVKHASEPSSLPAAQQDQLLTIRRNVMATISRLPKYLCTETVDRSTFLPKAPVTNASCSDLERRRKKPNWKVHESQSDRLRLDVAVSRSEGEMYSWVGENRFHDRSLADLVGGGVTSTGAFSAQLVAIFGSNAATFTYNGKTELDGRPLIEFGFRVPRDKSAFIVKNKKYSAIVPYSGVFLADPKTLDLVRLVVDAERLPQQLRACDDTTTLDYSRVWLNNAQFLLPQNVLMRITGDNGSEYENRTVFSACHEFLGESKLSFNTPVYSQVKAGERRAPQPLTLPAGLRFTLALTRPIETETAAAGDTITAKLATPLAEEHNHVLVPKGATVTGRIVKMERLYGASSLIVGIRLETIERGGVPQPFPARLFTVAKRFSDVTDPFGLIAAPTLGSFDQMPQLDDLAVTTLRLEHATKSSVIRRGLEFEGTTIEQQP
ncbi:MAG: hypothetical protein WB676_21240 [Bryobacteraceae bacterium]